MNDITEIIRSNEEYAKMYLNDAYFHNFIDCNQKKEMPIDQIIKCIFDLCKANDIRLQMIIKYQDRFGMLPDYLEVKQ